MVCVYIYKNSRVLTIHFGRETVPNGGDLGTCALLTRDGRGPYRVVVSTAAFHARVRGSVPSLGGLKETKMFLPHPRVKVSLWGASVTER